MDVGAGGGIDAARRHEAVLQRPQEFHPPVLLAGGRLDRRERAGHALTDIARGLLVTLCVLLTQHIERDFLFRQGSEQIIDFHLPILFPRCSGPRGPALTAMPMLTGLESRAAPLPAARSRTSPSSAFLVTARSSSVRSQAAQHVLDDRVARYQPVPECFAIAEDRRLDDGLDRDVAQTRRRSSRRAVPADRPAGIRAAAVPPADRRSPGAPTVPR